jgi:hypothetical protein
VPVALLLKNVLTTLRTAGTALAPWNDIVPLETTVVARARGAFLVHWFGPRLPLDGLTVRMYVTNTDALAQRFALASQSVPSSPGGPNLFGPVLGFAGLLAGVLLSPAGAVAGIYALLHNMGFSLKTILIALGWFAIPALLTAGMIVAPAGTTILFGGLLTAGAGGYALAGGLGDRRDLRALYDVFGSLARFMNAATSFLDLLRGPRANVRNPLLHQILMVADRLAPLFAQILGAIAIVVRRIGPLLPSIARTIKAIPPLVRVTTTALGTILGGLVDQLKALQDGPLSIVAVFRRIAGVAERQFTLVSDAIGTHLDAIAVTLTELGTALKDAADAFSDRAIDYVVTYAKGHPTVTVILALARVLKTFMGVWKVVPSAAPGSPPSVAQPLIDAMTAPLEGPIATLPSFPDLPEIPSAAQRDLMAQAMGISTIPTLTSGSVEAVAANLGRERTPAEHLQLTPATRTALERSGHRASVFAAERRGVHDQVLPLIQPQLDKIRAALALVVGRILPPEMHVYAPQLADTLQLIDEKLYGVPSLPAPAHPVLDLPSDERLRPKVKTLRLRLPGAARLDAERFEALVLERLRNRIYTIDGARPVAAGGG